MNENGKDEAFDTIVVGAGLAGLAAAAYLGRAGMRVMVLERSATAGGRAASRWKDGFCLNLGPHALYAEGEAVGVLSELGVPFRGAKPAAARGYALYEGTKHTLPAGFVSLLTTGLLGLGEKLELARVLTSLAKVDPARWDGRSVHDWLEATATRKRVRELLAAMVRLTSYANADDLMCAGVAVRQLRKALAQSVYYLDGGWQTLVDGVEQVAVSAGAQIRTGVKVEGLVGEGRLEGVRTSNGEVVLGSCVLLTTPPVRASAIAGATATSLAEAARAAVPIRAACLDLCVSSLSARDATFALGVDAPYYLSVHSAVAKLAPEGAATVQVAKYLPVSGDEETDDVRGELEAIVDLVQPGWRNALVEARFLPQMTVVEALPTAATGGLTGRPSVSVHEVPGLHLAGDWVGEKGHLADASLASAKRAATACMEYLARTGVGRVAA